MRVFVAGASGAIGEPLIVELLERGHSVVGMTTSEARAKNLEGQGAEAVIVDAFDAPAVEAALRRSKAEVVIDELTSLPKAQSDMPKYAAGDRKLRIEGGGNLFRAAHASGVRRYLQQSSGFFLKAAAGTLADESSPLDVNASPSVQQVRGRIRSWRRGCSVPMHSRVLHCDIDSSMGLRPGITPARRRRTW